jgi:putative phosphoribosyl transferase
MFRNREDAAEQLARLLQNRPLHDPLVLAVPRGGVVIGAGLAQRLGADLDVVLARKLRAPGHAELAVGAVGEDGSMYLNDEVVRALQLSQEYLQQEYRYQLAKIARRRELFRRARPAAPVAGRSVLLTDDGIATGSTIQAALHVLRNQQPREAIVAVPVGPPDRLAALRTECDAVVSVLAPEHFWAVGQYYAEFPQVEDEEVLALLRRFAPGAREGAASGEPLRGQ